MGSEEILEKGFGYNCEEYGEREGPQPVYDVINFEAVALGNHHLLEEACESLGLDDKYGEKYCEPVEGGIYDDPAPMIDSIVRESGERFDSPKAIWLCTEDDVDRYCEEDEEPVKYEVPEDTLVLSDLGRDGALLLDSDGFRVMREKNGKIF